MESMFSLLMVMGVTSVTELQQNYYDIVGKLPVEIAIIILRKLNARTLISASRVNRRWFALCKSDRVLRARIRDQIYRDRIALIMSVNVEILRATQNVHGPFSSMNGLQQKRVTFIGYSTVSALVTEKLVHPYKQSGKQKKPRRAEPRKHGHKNSDARLSKGLGY